MLFDLRGRGRRRTVQVIYVTLAVLLGGGLVLFGIGGDVQGGLFDAFSGGGQSASEQLKDEVKSAEKKTRANPRDPKAWADLAQARYQLAGQTEGIQTDANGNQAYTGKARALLEDAVAAWDQHLKLAGDKPSGDAGQLMMRAFLSLNQPAKAVRAWEAVIDTTPKPGVGEYSRLAELAWSAGQTRKGDLAAERVVELTPKAERKQVRADLATVKSQAEQAAGGGAGAGAGAPPGAAPGGAGAGGAGAGGSGPLPTPSQEP